MLSNDLVKTLGQGRRAILDQVQARQPLERILTDYLVLAEVAAGGGMRASVLLVDPDGQRLQTCAAPNLPGPYSAAIDGLPIGAGIGSCGTAAHSGEPVYVADIETDPLWRDFKDFALPYGLRACWSTPIKDADGRLLGTFALYNHTPRSPSPAELDAIEMIAGDVALAITQSRLSNAS